MRQSRTRALLTLIGVIVALQTLACDKGGGIGAASNGKIVCLTPAGTSLLAAMGLGDRIVGVSGYETDPKLGRLPKVGDYERIDWEQFLALKPGLLIVQGKRDRLPAGVRERCEDNGIAISILQIDRLDDIYAAAAQLGQATKSQPAAEKLVGELRAPIAALPQPAAKVPALIVLNDSGTSVVGRETYLNDLLDAAGGQNVITTNGYITVDHEILKSLQPREVFLLMPGATDAMIAAAKKSIDVPAARNGHLHIATDLDTLLPGANVVALAQTFSDGIAAK